MYCDLKHLSLLNFDAKWLFATFLANFKAFSWFDLESKFHFGEVPRKLYYTAKGCQVKKKLSI